MRTAYSQGLRSDLTVFIRGGSYFLSSNWFFDDRDSPPSGYSVTYRNYPNETPVIVGGRRVSNWELVAGSVYRARVGTDWKFYTLFENGVRAQMARTPNQGYLRVQAAASRSDQANFRFVYAPGDVPDNLNSRDAQVYIWIAIAPSHDWWPEIVPIASIDRQTRTVTLSDAVAIEYSFKAGDRYFLQGARELLDQPGEFYLSESDGYLYYWPRSTPIEGQEIIAPTSPRVAQIVGRSPTTPVRNLRFEGLTFTVSDIPKRVGTYPAPSNAAVSLTNAESIAIRFCRIRNTGGSGIIINQQSQNNVVYGNLIEDVGVHGVWLQGPAFGKPATASKNQVSNNRIRRGGQLLGAGTGILLSNSGENELSHNTITDMPRMGIHLSGMSYGSMAPSYDGVAVTWENHWDFINTRNNVVAFNDVSRALTDSQDGGGIYLWGAGKGNIIQNNRVHDFTTAIPGGITHGIYFDDASDYNIVRNNIVYGIATAGSHPIASAPVMLKGIYNEFTNNIVITDGPSALIGTNAFAGQRNDHLRIARNIFYRASGSEIYHFNDLTAQTISGAERISESDRNLIYHASGRYHMGFRFAGEVITLAEWRARYGFDRASVTADPLFVNPLLRNYRLRPDSPAFALGFVEIDQASIGLKADFPFPRD